MQKGRGARRLMGCEVYIANPFLGSWLSFAGHFQSFQVLLRIAIGSRLASSRLRIRIKTSAYGIPHALTDTTFFFCKV